MTGTATRRGWIIALLGACAFCFALILVLSIKGSRDGGEAVGERSSVAQPAAAKIDATVAPVPSNPADAMLGTDSSMSVDAQQLVLVSTQPGAKPEQGTAQIGIDPRNPQTYAAGAQLANGARLRGIYRGYVILEKGGRESLLMVAGADIKLSAAHRGIGKDGSVLAVGGEEVVNRPLDKVATSREDLSSILRAEPYYERDELAGLKIIPGTNRSKLAQLELEPGDIVRSIEGKRIKSADAAWQALDDAISSRSSVTISVERQGAMVSMSLDGSRLADPQIPVTSFEPGPAMPGS
jgi:hypothetical protein